VYLYILLDVYDRQKHTDVSDAAEPVLIELSDAMPAVDDPPTPTAVDSDVTEFVTFGNTELLPATFGAATVPFTTFAGVALDKPLTEELLRFVTLAMFVTGGGDTAELLRLNTCG
jgi:hypothetical protein